jgi:hypothetical protein
MSRGNLNQAGRNVLDPFNMPEQFMHLNAESGQNKKDDGMMNMMMMMGMMGNKNQPQKSSRKLDENGKDMITSALDRQNQLIDQLRGGDARGMGELDDDDNDVLVQKLNELEGKITKMDTSKKDESNSLDGMFSEDMINMMMLNMQSSVQMMPLIQQKQAQQTQSQQQFQNY